MYVSLQIAAALHMFIVVMTWQENNRKRTKSAASHLI